MLQLAFLNYRKNAYILIEGKEASDRFFIIQKGQVRCSRVVSVVEDTILGPGDFVGVIPCMAGRPQIETVIALTDVVIISVKKDQYIELVMSNTPVALKIIRTFSENMRTLNDLLTKLTLKTNVVYSPEQLYSIASFYEQSGNIDVATYGFYQYLKACPQGYNAENAKRHFVALKPRSKAVYFEPSADAIRSYPKGTMIFSECQTGSDMYIIQSGQVKITKVVDNNEVILAVLKKGEFFGEMALLENKPRSASAIAFEDCKLMVVNKQNFNQMVQTQAKMIFQITTTFAERLWVMSRQLENTLIPDPINKLVDMLALQVEKLRVPCSKGATYQMDITPVDLANMCGSAKEEQFKVLEGFKRNSHIKIVDNKVFIKDLDDLIEFSIYCRNHSLKKSG